LWNKTSASEAQQGVGRTWKKEEARKSSVSSGFLRNFSLSSYMPLQSGSQAELLKCNEYEYDNIIIIILIKLL